MKGNLVQVNVYITPEEKKKLSKKSNSVLDTRSKYVRKLIVKDINNN